MAVTPNIPAVGSSSDPAVRRAINAIRDYLMHLEAVSGGTGGVAAGETIINNITNPTVGIQDPGTAIPLVSNPTGQGLFDSIMLTWDSPGADYFWLAKTEIYWSLDPAAGNDVENDANLLTSAPYPQSMILWTPPDTALSTTYYFWLRYITISDRVGGWSAMASATTADNPAYLKEVLTGEITESELFSNLTDGLLERIDLTDNIQQMLYDIGANATDIATETSQRTTEDAALASSISTVAATAAGNTAAIQTEATTRATADGLAYAEYTIKLDANGKIAGIGLAVDSGASGPISSIVQVLADTFAIAHPTDPGEPDVVPFVVSNGKVYMDTAYIEDATITNAHIADLAADKITAGSITAALAMLSPYIANSQTNPTFVLDMVNNYLRITGSDAGNHIIDGKFGFTHSRGIAAYVDTAAERVDKFWWVYSATAPVPNTEMRGAAGSACLVCPAGDIVALTPVSPYTGAVVQIPVAQNQPIGVAWKLSRSPDYAGSGNPYEKIVVALSVYNSSDQLLEQLDSYCQSTLVEPDFHIEIDTLTPTHPDASYAIPRVYCNGDFTAGELLVDDIRIFGSAPSVETSVTLDAGDLIFERGGVPYKSVKRIHSGLCYHGVPYTYPIPFVTTPTLIFTLEEATVFDRYLYSNYPHSFEDQVLRMYATDESANGFTPNAETFTVASYWVTQNGYCNSCTITTYVSGGNTYATLNYIGTQRTIPYSCQDSNSYLLDSAQWGTSILAFRARITCISRTIVSVWREQNYGSNTFVRIADLRTSGSYNYEFPSSWFATNGNRCRYIFSLYSDDNHLVIERPSLLTAIPPTPQGGTIRFLAIEEGVEA